MRNALRKIPHVPLFCFEDSAVARLIDRGDDDGAVQDDTPLGLVQIVNVLAGQVLSLSRVWGEEVYHTVPMQLTNSPPL